MKKLVTVSIIVLLSTFFVRSQSFQVGDMVLNAGFGLGRTYGSLGSSWLSITVTGERGFWEIGDFGVISIGALVGYQPGHIRNTDYRWNNFFVGPRGVFHFTIIPVEKLDVYAGIGLGLWLNSEPDYIWDPDDGWYYDKQINAHFYGGVFAGARYYFTDVFGVFGEVGYEVSWLKVGMSFKF
jgi:hypothetical protein